VTTSAAQIQRLLSLVPYLQRRGEVSVAEAARRFGVPERTIQGDLRVLMFCGLPGQLPGEVIDFDFEALEDEDVIRIRDAEFLPRPLRLGSREGTALLAALTALRESSGSEVREVVDRTLAKVRLVLPLAGDRLGAVLEGRYHDSMSTLRGGRVDGALVGNAHLLWRAVVPGLDVSLGATNVGDVAYGFSGSEDHTQRFIPEDGRRLLFRARYGF